jgi:hypothetical protein
MLKMIDDHAINRTDIQESEWDAKALPSVFLYYLVRFYFIFLPANLLLVKLGRTQAITYWKDLAYIICFFAGLKYLVNSRPILIYIILIVFTIILEFIHGSMYFEYITWLIMGLPLILYVRFISPEDYTKDCFLIGIIIVATALWTFFLESGGGYENSFAIDKTGFTLMRDEKLRVRFFFVSPMALSQYCWFALILFFTNHRLNVKARFLFIAAAVFTLLICNTRAGIMLLGFSFVVFAYIKILGEPKKWINVSLVLAFTVVVIIMVIKSALDSQGDVSDSDALRVVYLTLGLQSCQQNYLLGVGGGEYSPRSADWNNFENSLLALVNCFGIVGILLVLWLLYLMIFKSNHKSILLFSLPWVVYSIIFPVLQETTAVLVTWFILGLIIHEEKVDSLFFSETDDDTKF